MLKVIYAGTPDFAVPALQALIDSEHQVIAVYTQPDRPAGRGRKLTPSPVKQLAVSHDIPVYQPVNLKSAEDQQQLADLDADLMVVAAYGLILPKAVLEAPRLGCVNIHASLLPRWRGAAPIQRAILAGDEQSGITIMQMDVGLDTGDMLLKKHLPITDEDTGSSLHDKLMQLGADALMDVIPDIISGTVEAVKQDEYQVTYAEKLQKTEAQIDWQQPAVQIIRQVRAFNAWPVAQTVWDGQVMRIWRAQTATSANQAVAGTVVHADKSGIDVVTGEGLLRITELQLPGKKPMPAAAFLNAHDPVGSVLGT